MTTKREQIMVAVKSALAGISGVNDANVFRSKVNPTSEAKFPIITIEPIGESADNSTYSVNDWTLNIRVSIGLKAKIPDSAGDTIMIDIHQKLFTNTTLKNLITDMSITSNSFNNFEADGGFGIIEMNYSIRYRTQENSLT